MIGALGSSLVTESILLNDRVSPVGNRGEEARVFLPRHTVSAYTPHSPITITSNADFASQGWPGNGTESNPYVIEGLNITTSGNCISISDTTVYFVIRNCLLTGGRNWHGVSLDNVINGRIEGCTISGKSSGVGIFHSSNNTLVNNTISDNWHGVFIYCSSNNTLVNNEFVSNGLIIRGDSVSDWLQTVTSDNTVNGKMLGYFSGLTDGVIDGGQYGQVILANCTGVTIRDGVFVNSTVGVELGFSSNNTLVNNIISGNRFGVDMWYSSNNTLVNSIISNNSDGVYMCYSSNNGVVNNTISQNDGIGVFLGSSNYTSLTGNTISENGDDGVYLESSSNNSLVNNTISENSVGVSLYSSNNNSLVNNTISYNDDDGVWLYSSSNNSLVNNTISYNDDDGVFLYSSSNNTLVNNTISHNLWDGVCLDSSSNNTLVNNEFVNDGLFVFGSTLSNSLQNIISDNTVNGKLLGYFSGLTGGVIDGSQYGQVILVNCTGVTVQNGVFINSTVGVELGFSNNTLVNNTISHNSLYGVFLYSSSNNTLVNNTISHNLWDGVWLYSSSNNSLVNNTISDNKYGVHLWCSSDNSVANNTISDNLWDGVYLEFASDNALMNNTISDNGNHGVFLAFSPNNTLVNNEFVNNGLFIFGNALSDWLQTVTFDNTVNGRMLGYFSGLTGGVIDGGQYGQVILANCTGVTVLNGVFVNSTVGIALGYSSGNAVVNNTILYNSRYGVYLESSSNNVVMSSTISYNGDGIYLRSSSNNIVASNTVSDNSNCGVYLHFSSNNQIYLNIFAWNGNNAHDSSGSDNQWNITGIGNYWSDYNGTGVYSIAGSTGSVDYHPRPWSDTTPPTINNPSDIEYIEGTTGHSITWSPYDAYPASYEVYRNGSLIESGGWSGDSITINVDGLGIGSYNYTIVVYDKSGNWAKDTVFVTVKEAPDTDPPTIDHPADIEYVEGSTGHIVIWNPDDAHPAGYEIYRNGSLVVAGTWTGGPVTIGVDGLRAGTYNYTIVLYDESGNWVSDTVFVTVLTGTSTTSASTTSETMTSTTTAPDWPGGLAVIMVVVGAAAIAILVVLLVIMKRPRRPVDDTSR